MAGIYFHIPFCRKACHYCDFHFSTSLQSRQAVLQAMLGELEARKDYLQGETIHSIYFGGGTPSLLSVEELQQFLNECARHFHLSPDAEYTLEANPDDLDLEKVKQLRSAGFNRLSIGMQSFYDEDLLYMNRSHTAAHAEQCIQLARDGGFTNFSIDLIFGYPLLSDAKWAHTVEKVIAHAVPHISCYAMTVEPRTALASFIQSKKVPPMDAAQSAAQFEYLMEELRNAGYLHYEISNYCLPGQRAIHNSNYWKGIPYLGIGPSAHSFDGNSRQWNVANNALYLRAIEQGEGLYEQEILSRVQKTNETIMTSLRTMEGLPFAVVESQMEAEAYQTWKVMVHDYAAKGLLRIEADIAVLTDEGKLLADAIAAELFLEAED